jgi:hypothetical protein
MDAHSVREKQGLVPDLQIDDPHYEQQPREQGGANGRKFGNDSFFGIRSAVRLGLRLPSISRLRRNFFLGFAGPGRRAAAQGGAREGLWACQKGQMGQKLVRFGQLEAQRYLVKTSR